MMRASVTAFFLLLAVNAVAQTQTAAPPPPAPAPGSPATYVSGEALNKILKTAKVANGGTVTVPVTNTDLYRINVVHRAGPSGPALAHPGNTEMHYILEGSATVVTGGTLMRAAAGKPATIVDGVKQHVTKGDVILVPENSPHQYAEIDGVVTYLEVRWLAPK